MKKLWAIGCASALACVPGAAIAQIDEITKVGSAPEPEWVLPDPATIKTPDLRAGTEFDTSDDPKYFYFHKAGVSFERAAHDVRECLANTHFISAPRRMPAFAMISEIPPTPGLAPRLTWDKFNNRPTGLMGAILLPTVFRSVMRRHHQSIMRTCMGFKAYRRYPTTKEAYIALNEGDPMNSLLMQAKIASGPAPAEESAKP